ncbi:MAG TPA: DUF3618 domain-containing protein [Sporichthyaceae bacterium]
MGRSDPDALEAQIETAREQLAVTIDAIAERVAPKNVAAKAKSRAKGIVVNPDGSLKTDKVAIAGGVALAFVFVVVWRRFH